MHINEYAEKKRKNIYLNPETKIFFSNFSLVSTGKAPDHSKIVIGNNY